MRITHAGDLTVDGSITKGIFIEANTKEIQCVLDVVDIFEECHIAPGRDNTRFLLEWIQGWVSQMHKDITNKERGRIADDMCCEWSGSGIGASYADYVDTPVIDGGIPQNRG